MLIQNYGLFWRREWVHWGLQGGSAGHLKGIPAAAKRSEPTDFRDQQGIYALYDENFQLVYIGQAGGRAEQRLFSRLRQHRADQLADRWSRFSWFGIRRVLKTSTLSIEAIGAHTDTGTVLNQIEAVLIAVAEPVQNRQGGKFGAKAHQYLQFRDETEVGPDVETMIREIWQAKNG